MTERIILELSDKNAQVLSKEYDQLINRKANTLRGQGWDRQASTIEAELSEADLATKVSRLLEYHVEELES
jgi:hypothetical protein